MTKAPTGNPQEERWLRTVLHVPGMDCPSEERLIRLALAEMAGVASLKFQLADRALEVIHSNSADEIISRLAPLGLGARLRMTNPTTEIPCSSSPGVMEIQERRTLWILLAINGVMFVAETVGGLLAQSAGLMADALDMLADAAVYGLSLYAVGRSARLQVRAAHVSGWMQMALALGALAEVARRFVVGSEPEPGWMMGISVVALIANIACLFLISGHRKGGAHMKASWIFSTNDVLANLGVIVAGLLVGWTQTRFPDLIIGAIIAAIVFNGAIRILRLR
jgi:Co/Zn/Cd efflux system component